MLALVRNSLFKADRHLTLGELSTQNLGDSGKGKEKEEALRSWLDGERWAPQIGSLGRPKYWCFSTPPLEPVDWVNKGL